MSIEKQVREVLQKEGFTNGRHGLVALSGGGDSVALLVILNSLQETLRFKISAARVVHGIRHQNEEDAESALCKNLCEELGVPFSVLLPSDLQSDETYQGLLQNLGCGPEQAARELRRQQLHNCRDENGADCILYGHTADDRLETIFMRLLSGSGPEGLAGISVRNSGSLRPLLGISRSALRLYLTERNILWADDPSNSENAYRRNRVRNELIPLVSDIFPGWSSALDTLGERSREASVQLRRTAENQLPGNPGDGKYTLNLQDWDSASDYSRALGLWKGFNYLDSTGIPDHRFPWRRLKDARRAVNLRQDWNGPGLNIRVTDSRILLKRAETHPENFPIKGRIIVSRDEISDTYQVTLGGYRISVGLVSPDGGDFLSFSVRKWPAEIFFGTEGVSVTEFPSDEEQPDVSADLVYIFIEHLEEGIDARQQ